MGKQGGNNAGFPTTRWTTIKKAAREDKAGERPALEAVLKSYLPALRAYLVCVCGKQGADVDDILQGFVAECVLGRDLLAKAAPGKGRFRNFVLRSLKNYVISRYRQSNARKRAPSGGEVSLLDTHKDLAGDGAEPAAAFERQWARSVLSEAVARMEEECRQSGRAEIWGVFKARVLAPMLGGGEPLAYETLVRRYRFAAPSQATNALVTAKRMYRRRLRAVVGEYAESEDEVEEEIAELRAILSRGSGRAGGLP